MTANAKNQTGFPSSGFFAIARNGQAVTLISLIETAFVGGTIAAVLLSIVIIT